MHEISRPAEAAIIDCQCDKCGEGAMRHADGVALMSDPPQYRHVCTSCGYAQNYFCIYPRTEFRAVE